MILDTNAISAFAEGNPSIREIIAAASGPSLPVVVIGEYRFGLFESRDREARLRWLAELAQHWTVLEISIETAIIYADIRDRLKKQGTSVPSNDVWIAALGAQHGLPILTNDSHFDRIPQVERLSWS
jgi:tRNA(fMet)-specific endonuclease VapC